MYPVHTKKLGDMDGSLRWQKNKSPSNWTLVHLRKYLRGKFNWLRIIFFSGSSSTRVGSTARTCEGHRAGEGRVRVRCHGHATPLLHLGRLGRKGRHRKRWVRQKPRCHLLFERAFFSLQCIFKVLTNCTAMRKKSIWKRIGARWLNRNKIGLAIEA